MFEHSYLDSNFNVLYRNPLNKIQTFSLHLLRVFGNFASHLTKVEFNIDKPFANSLFKLFCVISSNSAEARQQYNNILNSIPIEIRNSLKHEVKRSFNKFRSKRVKQPLYNKELTARKNKYIT